MKNATLCYIERDGKILMMFRNKKPNDPNEGKWIGIDFLTLLQENEFR